MVLQINRSKIFNNFFEKSQNRIIKYLVLHHIQDKNLDSAIKELMKHEVSSHYIIDENGEIFSLVEESNIAYHAGISFWNGKYNLNEESIGIEFFSIDPYKKGFNTKQIESGVELCQSIVKKYNIEQKNIIGHSDIAYDKKTGFLNRKDDPSHLFPWEIFFENRLGIWPIINFTNNKDKTLFKIGDKDTEIGKIKQKLSNFGYKVDNLNDLFDEELKNIITVFHRRFNTYNYLNYKDRWLESSSKILEVIS